MTTRTEGSTDLPDSERQTYTVRETAAVMGLSLGVTYELLRPARVNLSEASFLRNRCVVAGPPPAG
jgi:anti-sigma regulatory factor (Ser/Thr protein kinase)